MPLVELNPSQCYQSAIAERQAYLRIDTITNLVNPDYPVIQAPSFFEILEAFIRMAQAEVVRQELRPTKSIHENLTLGKPFPRKEVEELKENRLAYRPEAYRSFLEIYLYCFKHGLLHQNYSSFTHLEYALLSFINFGLLSHREFRRLLANNLAFLTGLKVDLTQPDECFMHNNRFLYEPEAVSSLPAVEQGRPVVLLHGRFNAFPSNQYLQAILSAAVTDFSGQYPSFILGIEDDAVSINWEKQVPFMNQVFRAGFYSFLPIVSGVFLADQLDLSEGPQVFDDYWSDVYDRMQIDALVIEESDPYRQVKIDRLKRVRGENARVITNPSSFKGIPRLSSSMIRKGDKDEIKLSGDAQWSEMLSSIKELIGTQNTNFILIENQDVLAQDYLQPPLFIDD